jgi:hypothetical protein
MKPLPDDPVAFQARVFSAFCNDLFDIAAGKAKSCERTNALRHISTKEHRYGNVPVSEK